MTNRHIDAVLALVDDALADIACPDHGADCGGCCTLTCGHPHATSTTPAPAELVGTATIDGTALELLVTVWSDRAEVDVRADSSALWEPVERWLAKREAS